MPTGTIKAIEKDLYGIKFEDNDQILWYKCDEVKSLSSPVKELKKDKQKDKEARQYQADEELYSFDSVMVLEIGSDEEVSDNIIDTHYRPYGIFCLFNIGAVDLAEAMLKK